MKLGRWLTRLAFVRTFPFIASAQTCFQRGLHQAGRGDLLGSVRHFQQVIALKPRWAEPYRRIGDALLTLQKPTEAARFFETAVALKPEDETALLGYLTALVLSGQRAVAAGILNLTPEVFAEFPHSQSNVGGDISISGPSPALRLCASGRHELWGNSEQVLTRLVQQVRHYAGGLYLSGQCEQAIEFWTRCCRWQNQLIERANGSDGLIQYLTDEWTCAIGHIGLIDFYVKLFQLGYLHKHRPLFLLPERSTIANAALFNYWQPYVDVVRDLAEAKPSQRTVKFSDVPLNVLPLNDGRNLFYNEAAALAQKTWEEQGRCPLLQVNLEHREKGWRNLNQLGLPAGAWFVSVHVREAGFHKHENDARRTGRNADITAYLPAMKAVHERGGWIVRIGDPTMKPLPAIDRVIDYARSNMRSDWMDVFLMGACRFFVGTNSGPGMVPPVFGVPCVYTNWMPVGCLPWHGGHLLIHKLYWSDTANRHLTYWEMLPHPLKLLESIELLSHRGVSVIDNSPEDISGVVTEMLDRCEPGFVPSNEDVARQRQFAALAKSWGVCCGPAIGSSFLKKYEHLLEKPDTQLNFG